MDILYILKPKSKQEQERLDSFFMSCTLADLLVSYAFTNDKDFKFPKEKPNLAKLENFFDIDYTNRNLIEKEILSLSDNKEFVNECASHLNNSGYLIARVLIREGCLDKLINKLSEIKAERNKSYVIIKI
jgi:hypothetical protein